MRQALNMVEVVQVDPQISFLFPRMTSPNRKKFTDHTQCLCSLEEPGSSVILRSSSLLRLGRPPSPPCPHLCTYTHKLPSSAAIPVRSNNTLWVIKGHEPPWSHQLWSLVFIRTPHQTSSHQPQRESPPITCFTLPYSSLSLRDFLITRIS